MTFLLTKTVIVAAIIIFAAVAALTMYSLLAYSSKSKSDYEMDMDDQEQIEYLRSVSRKKNSHKIIFVSIAKKIRGAFLCRKKSGILNLQT